MEMFRNITYIFGKVMFRNIYMEEFRAIGNIYMNPTTM